MTRGEGGWYFYLVIFINFKTYKQGTGDRALSLAKVLDETSKETGIEIIACPQAIDFEEIKKSVSIPVWTQHVDPIEQGKFTGWMSPESAKAAGAEGTLLNHSEHKIPHEALSHTVQICREVGLKTLVFADNLEEALKIKEFAPDLIGYEPPELVGSTSTSVAKEKPETIKKVVEQTAPVPVLVGAGIHTRQDIEVSVQLGATGVVVATDIVLSEHPKQELLDLIRGF